MAEPVGVTRANGFDKLTFGVDPPEGIEEIIDVMDSLPGRFPVQPGILVGVALERSRYVADIDRLHAARQALLRAVKGEVREELTIARPRLDFGAMRYSAEQERLVPIDPSKV